MYVLTMVGFVVDYWLFENQYRQHKQMNRTLYKKEGEFNKGHLADPLNFWFEKSEIKEADKIYRNTNMNRYSMA